MILKDKLESLNACGNAIEWVFEMNGNNPEKLWDECERGDWMLWLIAKLNIDRKRLVLATCQCARLSLHLAKGKEARIAIETAEAWASGEATVEQVSAAAAAAYAANAANAYAAYAAAYAANAANAYAAYAANAAYAAADANANAAAAAYAAAAYANAAYAARKDTLKKCAKITRCRFTYEEIAQALEL